MGVRDGKREEAAGLHSHWDEDSCTKKFHLEI